MMDATQLTHAPSEAICRVLMLNKRIEVGVTLMKSEQTRVRFTIVIMFNTATLAADLVLTIM